MNNSLGSGNNGQFTFLDIISIMSFITGVMNLSENLTQRDKQDLQKELANQMNNVLTEIHSHLEKQDKKIDLILEEISNDNR